MKAETLPFDGHIAWYDFEVPRHMGIIQEVNRRLLHPRGLALVVGPDPENPNLSRLGLMMTRDPEGIIFEGDQKWMREAREKAARFDSLLEPERGPIGIQDIGHEDQLDQLWMCAGCPHREGGS